MKTKPRLKAKYQRRGSQSGFSILEIMVVVIIIGLLATVVGVGVFGLLADGKIGVAKTQVCNIEKALDLYKLKKGNYPSDAEGLKALISAGVWKKSKIPKDPWNFDYQYRQRNPNNPSRPDIFSYGGDGKEGGTKNEDKDVRCDK